LEEIKASIFALNKDSAPGPHEFEAFFFQKYWQIIKEDITNVMLEFFTKSWILLGYNSYTTTLIPKIANATSIDQYRPIAMTNFKFKIITKIIAERLSQLMPIITISIDY